MDFPNVIGHEKQKEMFRKAAQNGRLVHAYAFVGVEHTGKTTFALDLAAALGAHPVLDVSLFEGEEDFGVEQARALQRGLSLAPAGKWKAGIVTRAERMTVAAANSLLKTLEEPPAHSIIILITTNWHSLLPTVASRVQRINFAPEGRMGLRRRLESDALLAAFFESARQYYDVLKIGSPRERLQTAAEAAALPDHRLRDFLDIAMREYAAAPAGGIGGKLLGAWQGMAENLNVKLLMDNLFLE